MESQKLDALLGELTPEMREYFFPGWFSPEPPTDNHILWYRGISCPTLVADKISDIADALYEELGTPEPEPEPMMMPEAEPERKPEPEVEEVLPDPRVQDFLKELSRIQEKYNISIEELDAILKYTVSLSHLHINRYGKITLSDFGNREIKMPGIAKSLYFLYLRHPEGLRYKDIADHRDELLGIYRKITGRDDPEAIEKSIDLLVDPYGNGLNVNASRIKTAFRNAVDDRIAQFYYISGAAGEIKKVPLDRDLVIWEY